MTRLSIRISPELRQAVRLPPEEVSDRIKRELAIRLYKKGLLTFGQARQLAGVPRWDFRHALAEEDVPRRYDIEELEEDLKTLKALEWPS